MGELAAHREHALGHHDVIGVEGEHPVGVSCGERDVACH